MNRSAPAKGYNFGTKRHYRRQVWKAFREHCVGRLDTAHALLMPSIEGDEIEQALRSGFRERNLHVVDRNPAIVAHLKRRYRNINTYGVNASHAAHRIADRGIELSVANLDLCSPVSEAMLDEIQLFVQPKPVRHGGLIAINMLRGREQDYGKNEIARQMDRGQQDRDQARIDAVWTALCCVDGEWDIDPWQVKSGKYRSVAGTQTMLWAIYRVKREPRLTVAELRAAI